MRNFLNFEVLQQAAATLDRYEGLVYTAEPSRTSQLGEELNERTGLEWLPRRAQDDRVLFNPEGSIFRNKARVLTSMGILDAEALRVTKTVELTAFGKALGQGRLSRERFYEDIVTSFSYPHPAYPDGGNQWREASASVRPFVLIIKVLTALVRIDPHHNTLSSAEFVDWVASQSPNFDPNTSAEAIRVAREDGAESQNDSPQNAARRNATDLFGFLCITGLTYFISSGTIALNLVSVSSRDKTHFFLNRNGESSLDRIEAILEREPE